LLGREQGRIMLKSNSRGFTLVELMVVIAIVGILVLLGAPEFGVWQANSQIRSVAEAFQNDLRAAQAEAVKRNRRVALVLTNAGVSDNTNFAAANPARNWAVITLPLTGSAEESSFISSYIQNAGSNTLITGGVGAICFNSVGRLTGSAEIARAGNVVCAIDEISYDFDISRSNLSTDNRLRPLRLQVRLGGQIRLCDPSLSGPAGCIAATADPPPTPDDSDD